MPGSKSNASTIGGMCVLSALGAAVTCAMFLVFVPGPERGMTFYVAMSIVVTAELVLFAHLAYSRLARAHPPGPSRATRLEVHALILLWLIAAIITAVFAVRPENADTFTADKILVIYLLVTFLFFLAAYFLYGNSIEIERTDAQLVAERRIVTSKAPDIEHIIRAVERIGRRNTEHAMLADRVGKKLDTLRSGLDSAFVSERALGQPTNSGQDWNSQLEKQVSQLVSLSDSASEVASEKIPELLDNIASKAESVMVVLRRREESLTG
jgi:hypothetical protein